jgi:hypothetical protein
MPKFTYRLCLDLADAFSGYLEFHPDLFQSPVTPIPQAESQGDHSLFTRGEFSYDVGDFLFQQLLRGGFNSAVDRLSSMKSLE